MEKKEPSYTVGENVNCIATIENNMEIPLKTKNRTAIQFNSPTSGHISEENSNLKDICIPMFIEALFTIAREWKQLKCPSIEKCIRMCYVT